MSEEQINNPYLNIGFPVTGRYMFYIAKTYSVSIIKPLAAFLDRCKAEYCFFVSDKVKQVKPVEWADDLVLTDLKDARKFNPDFVLCPGNFVDFRIPGIKVQVFHGLGVEKAVHYKIRHFFDIYLTSGPFVTNRYEQMRLKDPYFLIIETGWPKIDYILNYPVTDLKKKTDIPEDKKIILYAPTFSTQHESATALIQIIPKIMKDNEFWLFKFHELMDAQVIDEFKKIDPNKGRVLPNVEITPYLHAADVMISDTSSVIYEFMVLDKPIITYKTQARENKGINIHNPSELRDAINRSLENTAEYSDLRQQHLKEINPVLDGKISENIIEQLEKVKNENLLPAKRKPLNLFRKLQIVYHSKFRKGYLR